MKRIIYTLSTILLIFTMAYLIGSFVEANFLFTNWDRSTREAIGIVGGVFSCMGGVLIFLFYNAINNK